MRNRLVLLGVLMFIMTLGTVVPAQAGDRVLSVKVITTTSCDQRDPIVEVTLTRHVKTVQLALPDSDPGFIMLDRDVSAGSHKYTLARQGFGTTQQWVIVVTYDRDGFEYSRVLTFSRPPRSECVADRNPRFDRYARDINEPCPVGSDKMFIAVVRVKSGTPGYILRPGTAEIVRMNDKQMNAEGHIVKGTDQRLVEYYFFAPSRKTRIKTDPAENSA